MKTLHKSNHKIEFGDFQTPDPFALKICDFIKKQGVKPKTIIEPTCGIGNFVINSDKVFSSAEKIFGLEINNNYINILKEKIKNNEKIIIENQDFFKINWNEFIDKLHEPILMIGNPPWVTNSKLSSISSSNLPEKNNILDFKGIEAITGKSNFDISEWMIIKLLKVLQYKKSVLAFLCKTSVARKVLKYIWNNHFQIKETEIYLIDSKEHFNVSVDACLFLCHSGKIKEKPHCNVFSKIGNETLISSIGLNNNELLADVRNHKKYAHLEGDEHYVWRSGIKHDSAKVMEFVYKNGKFINGFGESVDLEFDYLYPLYKSSDIAKKNLSNPRKWVLVTQKEIGSDTRYIKYVAPKTYRYLEKYSDILLKRRSSIYKNKPLFSIFGIGKYSFSNYKIAISGLYKNINFQLLKPFNNKPIMVDDTCYIIPCESEFEADLLYEALNSKIARNFFRSYIFWDSKRPITSSILKKLDILKLSRELNLKKLTKIIEAKTQSNQRTMAFMNVV